MRGQSRPCSKMFQVRTFCDTRTLCNNRFNYCTRIFAKVVLRWTCRITECIYNARFLFRNIDFQSIWTAASQYTNYFCENTKISFCFIVSIFHNLKVVSLSNFVGIFPSGNWRWISVYITCELLAVMQYCNKFNIITRLCSDDDNNLFIYLTWRCPSISNWILCCYAMDTMQVAYTCKRSTSSKLYEF